MRTQICTELAARHTAVEWVYLLLTQCAFHPRSKNLRIIERMIRDETDFVELL